MQRKTLHLFLHIFLSKGENFLLSKNLLKFPIKHIVFWKFFLNININSSARFIFRFKFWPLMERDQKFIYNLAQKIQQDMDWEYLKKQSQKKENI